MGGGPREPCRRGHRPCRWRRAFDSPGLERLPASGGSLEGCPQAGACVGCAACCCGGVRVAAPAPSLRRVCGGYWRRLPCLSAATGVRVAGAAALSACRSGAHMLIYHRVLIMYAALFLDGSKLSSKPIGRQRGRRMIRRVSAARLQHSPGFRCGAGRRADRPD